MKYCGQCGQQLPDEARFCDKCGDAVQGQKVTVPAEPGEEGSGSSPGQPMQSNIPPIPVKTPGRNFPIKIWTIFTGIVIALLLVAGGFWGWQNLGSEARVQKKLELAVKYLGENKYEEAILAYNDAIKIEPKEVKAYQGLARALTLQGKYDEANNAYNLGIRAVAQDNQQKLTQGTAGLFIDKGDFNEAEKVYRSLINENKNCLEAYDNLSMIYEIKSDNIKANQVLQEALINNKSDYRVYNLLAAFEIGDDQTESQAFNDVVKSLEFNHEQNESFRILTIMYTDDWDGLIDKASTVSDNKVRALIKIFAYQKNKKYQEALAEYQAVGFSEIDRMASIMAASCYNAIGLPDQAHKLVNSIKPDQTDELVMTELARYYLINNDKEKAVELAVTSLKMDEQNLDALRVLKDCYQDEPKKLQDIITRYIAYSRKPLKVVYQEIQVNGFGNVPLWQGQNSHSQINILGVKLGDTYDQVITTLNNPKKVTDDVFDILDKSRRVGKSLNYDFCNVGVSKFSNRVIFVALRNGVKATNEGIKVGDSLVKVTQMYGNNYILDSSKEKVQTLLYYYSNGILAFDCESDTVQTIRLYRTPVQKRYIP